MFRPQDWKSGACCGRLRNWNAAPLAPATLFGYTVYVHKSTLLWLGDRG
jgi:hypothetical protein